MHLGSHFVVARRFRQGIRVMCTRRKAADSGNRPSVEGRGQCKAWRRSDFLPLACHQRGRGKMSRHSNTRQGGPAPRGPLRPTASPPLPRTPGPSRVRSPEEPGQHSPRQPASKPTGGGRLSQGRSIPIPSRPLYFSLLETPFPFPPPRLSYPPSAPYYDAFPSPFQQTQALGGLSRGPAPGFGTPGVRCPQTAALRLAGLLPTGGLLGCVLRTGLPPTAIAPRAQLCPICQ